MQNIVLLSDEQANYLTNMIESHFVTYSKNEFISSIYLSAYRDSITDNPTIELTLVADWFKCNDLSKVVMGYFSCPESTTTSEAPIYILSMANAKKYKGINEDSLSEEDEEILSDIDKSCSILMDKDGTCRKLQNIKRKKTSGKTYQKISFVPKLEIQ